MRTKRNIKIEQSKRMKKLNLNMEKQMNKKEMEVKVSEALEQIRPALQRDGGDVSLKKISKHGVVIVKLEGACADCPMSQMTLKMGIEAHVKKMVPEVTEVRNER